MALLAGAKPGHVELAGVKQWWGTDISEISVDAPWQYNGSESSSHQKHVSRDILVDRVTGYITDKDLHN